MARLDDSPFIRSAFSPVNLSQRMSAEIASGRRPPIDSVFLSAASLVARAVKQADLLTNGLGDQWRAESRFVPAVERELADLKRVVGAARAELKAWRPALRGFRFDGMDFSESFDVSQEESLALPLRAMQIGFLTRITGAREAIEAYGPRSFMGVETYFQLSHTRKSGPIPKLSPDVLAALADTPSNGPLIG